MKKFLAMVLCLALVAALGVSAFADTITTGPIFVYEETGKGASYLDVTSSKTLTTAKTVEEYITEKTKEVAKSDARKAAEAAKNLYEAEMVAAAEALKSANAALDWAKADYNATAKAMTAAAKNAIAAYQNIYKAAVSQQIALEYLDFGVQYSNAMNEAIAEMQIALNEALPTGSSYHIVAAGTEDDK
jgi:hypothetical protein